MNANENPYQSGPQLRVKEGLDPLEVPAVDGRKSIHYRFCIFSVSLFSALFCFEKSSDWLGLLFGTPLSIEIEALGKLSYLVWFFPISHSILCNWQFESRRRRSISLLLFIFFALPNIVAPILAIMVVEVAWLISKSG